MLNYILSENLILLYICILETLKELFNFYFNFHIIDKLLISRHCNQKTYSELNNSSIKR